MLRPNGTAVVVGESIVPQQSRARENLAAKVVVLGWWRQEVDRSQTVSPASHYELSWTSPRVFFLLSYYMYELRIVFNSCITFSWWGSWTICIYASSHLECLHVPFLFARSTSMLIPGQSHRTCPDFDPRADRSPCQSHRTCPDFDLRDVRSRCHRRYPTCPTATRSLLAVGPKAAAT
jgi:hypothetical protein